MPYVPGRLNGIPGRVTLDITGDVCKTHGCRGFMPTLDEAQLSIQSELKNVSGKTQNVTFRPGTIMPGNIKFEDCKRRTTISVV